MRLCVCERQAAAAQRGAQQQRKKKGKKKGKKPKKDGLDMEEILAVQVTHRRLPVPCSWPDNRHDGESVDWVAGRVQETIAKLSAGEKPTAPGEVNVREANIWPESVKPPEAIRTRPSTGKASLQHGNPNRKAAAASSTSSAGWGASDVPQLDAPRSTVERIAAAHNVSTEHLEAAAERGNAEGVRQLLYDLPGWSLTLSPRLRGGGSSEGARQGSTSPSA